MSIELLQQLLEQRAPAGIQAVKVEKVNQTGRSRASLKSEALKLPRNILVAFAQLFVLLFC